MRMRKKRHGSERLSVLSALLYPFPEKTYIPAEEVFLRTAPLYLEVGCGKGDFIKELSSRNPGNDYIALEKISDAVVCAVEKYASSRDLGRLGSNGGWIAPDGHLYKNGEAWDIPAEMRGNVRFIVADAADFTAVMPDNSLSGIMANFSDPWARKCGYEKRRLTNPAFLENYKRILNPDGIFSFKTDNDALFDYTLETLPQSGFDIAYMTRDLHSSERNADNIVTEYEKNFVEQGMKIKMLEACPKK